MKKKWLSSLILFLGIFLLPALAFAEGEENPITKLKEYMKFNWGVLAGLGWLFYFIMIPFTLIVIGLLAWSIISVIQHLWKVKRAKASLKDKAFWIETGVTILIIFLFISGAFWNILEKIYDWTSTQKIGEDVTGTAFVTPLTQTKFIIQDLESSTNQMRSEYESFLL